jgi:hypothetical protein
MLTDQKFIKEQVTAFGGSVLDSDLEIGNSRFGIGLIMAMAGFVGAWGCLCLINGIVQSQSLHDIGRGVITALIGI